MIVGSGNVWRLFLALVVCFTWKSAARKVELDLVLTHGLVSPDGYERQMVLINGTTPGPQIRVRYGDTLIIRVHNDLFYEGAAIHIHGLHNRGGPQYDGVAYGTQWPILPGKSFTYRYTIFNPPGTYWYHAHYQLQSQAVYGSFVIEDDQDLYAFDEERSLLLTDWFHQDDVTQLMGLMSSPFKWIGDPQSVLINGRGRFNCSLSIDPSPTCNSAGKSYEMLEVEKGKTYRLRIVNAASLSYFRFAITGHKITIIETDGLYVEPYDVTELEIGSGERYSVLLRADQTIDNYGMYVNVRYRPKGPSGYAVLHYKDAKAPVLNPEKSRDPAVPFYPESAVLNPSSVAEWVLPQLKPNMKDKHYMAVPLQATKTFILEGKQIKVPHPVKGDANATMMHWAINGRPYEMNPDVPLLMAAYGGQDALMAAVEETSKPSVINIEYGDVVDIVLQNTVALNGVCEQHPWHLHGHHFWNVASGSGSYIDQKSKFEVSMNLKNPIMKDSITLYPHSNAFFQEVNATNAGKPCGWRLLRFSADNPGLWNFHCHITSHMHMGMQVFFAEGVNELQWTLDESMKPGGLGFGDNTTLEYIQAQREEKTGYSSGSRIYVGPNIFMLPFLALAWIL